MAYSFGPQKGSTRLSKLVTDLNTESLANRDLGSRASAGAETAGLHSDEEGVLDLSEDEEDLIRNSTPFLEEEEEGSVLSHKILFEAQALSDFQGEEEGDLWFKEREILTILESSRDDGWLLAENALGERGLVPSNFIKQLTEKERPSRAASPTDPSTTPRRGRDLWSKLRQTVKQTTLADVLSALGAIPSGFRESTMAKLLADSSAYLMSTWIMPHPSSTAMAFRDLKWNHTGDHLLPMPSKINLNVVVLLAKMIPLPGTGVDILSRHVRVAIFNKNEILSNIHTVRAVWSPQDEKGWKFVSKSQTATNSLYHQVCTVRVDSNDTNLELLFEFGITFCRAKTGEQGELSCGWSSLPLYDHTGNLTPCKTYELKIHGGTPFESGVELDASNIKAAGGGILPTMLRARQTPRLYVRLETPSRSQRATQALLPPTIITASTYNQAISCFRHSVGVACLRGRLGLQLQSFVVKPALNVFLKAVDHADVMDTILALLLERLKLAKRANKQSLGYVSGQLDSVLLRTIYPLLNSISFPSPVWADEAVEKKRVAAMENYCRRTDLSALLSSDVKQATLKIHEQIFSIYSLP